MRLELHDKLLKPTFPPSPYIARTLRTLEQLARSSPFFTISDAVQKVFEDGIVRAIIHCLTL